MRICTAALATALLFCGREYNPFANAANAGLFTIRQSLHAGDTVDVFTTETLSVIVTVKELVAGFSVRCKGNRLWPSADSAIAASAFSSEPFLFCFSFPDTGLHAIITTVHRTNGDSSADTMEFFVRSPLRQDPVTGWFGDPVLLRTNPVGDRDVDYFWSFGAGTVISSRACSTSAAISVASAAGIGRLWVSDGLHASPAQTFFFSLGDTTPPSISCQNSQTSAGDTVFTADTDFAFMVRITDRGDLRVDTASINGGPFDRVDNNLYSKLFTRCDQHTAANPLIADVYAMDNFRFQNETVRRFFIIFSPLAAASSRVRLLAQSPAASRIVSSDSTFTIFGTVENRQSDTPAAELSCSVNGAIDPGTITVRERMGAWQWVLHLALGDNAVVVRARDRASGDSLAALPFVIVYDPAAVDSLPPAIDRVLADGKPAANYITDKATVMISARCVDAGSGLALVRMNDSAIVPGDTAAVFFAPLALVHAAGGNEMKVYARDRSGNNTTVTVVVYRNRLPVIYGAASSAFIYEDSLYRDTISAVDPDGDRVSFEKYSGPAGLSITADGIIAWRPDSSARGKNAVSIRVWDGYQPSFVNFSLYVHDASGPPLPVRLVTRENAFPAFMRAGTDSLRLMLRTEHGIAPFFFTARVLETHQAILSASRDSVVRFAPDSADTGLHHFIVFARDAFAGDTIWPQITVLPPNHPCRLQVVYASDTLAGGILDLNSLAHMDTLRFFINDPDDPTFERHTVQIMQARAKSMSVIDSAAADSFSIAVDPTAFNGYDTITVGVHDRAGAADTVRMIIYYGAPPDTAHLVAPLMDATTHGASVTLDWTGSDPDGDALTYDVYTGAAADQLTKAATITQSQYALTGVQYRTWYWRVDAKDWKSTAQGNVWRFIAAP